MHGLDEIDYGILDALILRPRASWALIGSVLGVSASTTARRWEAMRAHGIAWMSGVPGPNFGDGYRTLEILVQCNPGQHADAVKALMEHPPVFSLSSTVGDWDLVVNTLTDGGTGGVESLLNDPVWAHPSILGRQLSEATHTFSNGRDWKFGALSPAQIESLKPRPSLRKENVDPEIQQRIVNFLQSEPRMSVSRIAEEFNISAVTVGRQIEHMLFARSIILRTEVSAVLTGWPAGIYLYFDVPPTELTAAGRFVAQMSTTRLTKSVVHPRWNLSTVHWGTSLAQTHEIEAAVLLQFPGARVISRASRLREIKRAGWLLDENHRPYGRVPTSFGATPPGHGSR